MIITESKMTKEDCDRINKKLTRVREEQGITLERLIPIRTYSPGGKFYMENGKGPYVEGVRPDNTWTQEYLEGLMPTCPPEPKEWSELVELWCKEGQERLGRFWSEQYYKDNPPPPESPLDSQPET